MAFPSGQHSLRQTPSAILPDPVLIDARTDKPLPERVKTLASDLRQHLTRLNQALSNEFLRRPPPEESVLHHIYLRASNGNVYEVTVGNTGTLTTTLKYTEPGP